MDKAASRIRLRVLLKNKIKKNTAGSQIKAKKRYEIFVCAENYA